MVYSLQQSFFGLHGSGGSVAGCFPEFEFLVYRDESFPDPEQGFHGTGPGGGPGVATAVEKCVIEREHEFLTDKFIDNEIEDIDFDIDFGNFRV